MNALKKINERVKQLKKKHPNAKRTTLQKQAGREWKSGKLKKKRAAVSGKPKKVARRKKPARRNKVASPKVRTRTVVKTVYRTRRVKIKSKPRRRVGSRTMGGKSLMPILAIAGLGIGAYLLLNRNTPAATTYIPTGNIARDNSASNILAYATAAGLTATAIAKLISALNNSSDSTVVSAGNNPASALPAFLQGD